MVAFLADLSPSAMLLLPTRGRLGHRIWPLSLRDPGRSGPVNAAVPTHRLFDGDNEFLKCLHRTGELLLGHDHAVFLRLRWPECKGALFGKTAKLCSRTRIAGYISMRWEQQGRSASGECKMSWIRQRWHSSWAFQALESWATHARRFTRAPVRLVRWCCSHNVVLLLVHLVHGNVFFFLMATPWPSKMSRPNVHENPTSKKNWAPFDHSKCQFPMSKKKFPKKYFGHHLTIQNVRTQSPRKPYLKNKLGTHWPFKMSILNVHEQFSQKKCWSPLDHPKCQDPMSWKFSIKIVIFRPSRMSRWRTGQSASPAGPSGARWYAAVPWTNWVVPLPPSVSKTRQVVRRPPSWCHARVSVRVVRRHTHARSFSVRLEPRTMSHISMGVCTAASVPLYCWRQGVVCTQSVST